MQSASNLHLIYSTNLEEGLFEEVGGECRAGRVSNPVAGQHQQEHQHQAGQGGGDDGEKGEVNLVVVLLVLVIIIISPDQESQEEEVVVGVDLGIEELVQLLNGRT